MQSRYKNYPQTCNYSMKRTWKCLFEQGHDGPCGLVPRWWNISYFARLSRKYGA